MLLLRSNCLSIVRKFRNTTAYDQTDYGETFGGTERNIGLAREKRQDFVDGHIKTKKGEAPTIIGNQAKSHHHHLLLLLLLLHWNSVCFVCDVEPFLGRIRPKEKNRLLLVFVWVHFLITAALWHAVSSWDQLRQGR